VLTNVKFERAGAIATFGEGPRATGSLLTGCNGLKSRVRELMVDREASELSIADITITNFPCTYTAEQSATSANDSWSAITQTSTECISLQ